MSDGVRFSSAGPLSLFAIVLLIALLILIIPLLILGVIGAAFTRLGFSWISALAIVLLMLFGSFVNIPVYKIRRDMIRIAPPDSSIFGEYSQSNPSPVWDTTIAINLGGAVIPVAVSLYMLYQAILITGTSLLFSVCVGTHSGGSHNLCVNTLSTRFRDTGIPDYSRTHRASCRSHAFRWNRACSSGN